MIVAWQADARTCKKENRFNFQMLDIRTWTFFFLQVNDVAANGFIFSYKIFPVNSFILIFPILLDKAVISQYVAVIMLHVVADSQLL